MTENAETQQQPTVDQTEEPKTVAGMTAAEVAMEGRRLATSYLVFRQAFLSHQRHLFLSHGVTASAPPSYPVA